MSAGTGIWHIEGNNSDHQIRYLQLWLRPNKMGINPKYDFNIFKREDKLNKLCPIASQMGSPITIQSDAIVEAGIFTQDYTDELEIDRKYYIYVLYGTITINGTDCVEGDAMIFEEESLLKITNSNECEIIVFNLP
jgi:redox-sensitive bicupin YhaK (pirin superfamily)